MPIIAIDGPVGSGKSTIARTLAKQAGFAYLDTGAMYRAIGWKAYTRTPPPLNPLPQGEGRLEEQSGGEGAMFIPPPLTGGGQGEGGQRLLSDEDLRSICATTQLDMELENDHLRVMVDGKDVSSDIRTPEISRMASVVSAFPSVRGYLVRMQREIGYSWGKRYGGVVVEGRDIGTVVFPDTPFKFYLDADIEERGKRRWKELKDKGMNVTLNETIDEIIKRDESDQGREIDPLRKADDAIVIDTTGLTVESVVTKILKMVNQNDI